MTYATHRALGSARTLGIRADQEDFRDAFLSITDRRLCLPSDAALIGPTRLANEVWSIKLCGRTVVAVYDPGAAIIVTVKPPRAAS